MLAGGDEFASRQHSLPDDGDEAQHGTAYQETKQGVDQAKNEKDLLTDEEPTSNGGCACGISRKELGRVAPRAIWKRALGWRCISLQ